MVTASALQLHPKCQVVVDEEAASELTDAAYHRWVFANEPEWAPPPPGMTSRFAFTLRKESHGSTLMLPTSMASRV